MEVRFREYHTPKGLFAPIIRCISACACFCTFGGMCLDLPTYGSPAVRKLRDFSAVARNVWPARVKLDFGQSDGGGTTVVWRCKEQQLHDVFHHSQLYIHDFKLVYHDADGDIIELQPTEAGISEWANEAGCSMRLGVEWRLATYTESLVENLQHAKQEVEESGGSIIPGHRSPRFVDHRGYDATTWTEVCPRIATELGLSDSEKEGLLNAVYREEGRSFHSVDRVDENRVITRIAGYHTMRRGEKIDLVYGVQEFAMEAVMSRSMRCPLDICIRFGTTVFQVLPPASPDIKERGTDTENKEFDIPAGWQVVNSSRDGFNEILTNVIRPHNWHAHWIVTLGPGERRCSSWGTAQGGTHAGKMETNSCPFSLSADGKTGKFTGGASYRLLIEQGASIATDLIHKWRKYAELSAYLAWAEHVRLATAATSSYAEGTSDPIIHVGSAAAFDT